MQTTLKPLFDQLILTNNRPAVEVPPSVKLEDILQAINNGWLEVVMVNRPPLRCRPRTGLLPPTHASGRQQHIVE